MGETMTDAIIETLWQTYRTPLLYFIRSRVANNDEAEDLLQEVFLRVHRHLCCADDWQRPQAWFYQIARNLIIDHYRSTRELAEITDNLPAVDMDLEQSADDFETQLSIALKDTVLELPEPYREALLRTEYDGLSNQQLADELGISLSGAKSRVCAPGRSCANCCWPAVTLNSTAAAGAGLLSATAPVALQPPTDVHSSLCFFPQALHFR